MKKTTTGSQDILAEVHGIEPTHQLLAGTLDLKTKTLNIEALDIWSVFPQSIEFIEHYVFCLVLFIPFDPVFPNLFWHNFVTLQRHKEVANQAAISN